MKKALLAIFSFFYLLSCSNEDVVAPNYWQLVPNNNMLPLSSIWGDDEKVYIGGGSLGVDTNQHLGIIMSYDGQRLISENVSWEARALVVGGANTDFGNYAAVTVEDGRTPDEIVVFNGEKWVPIVEAIFKFTNVKSIDGSLYLASYVGVYKINETGFRSLNAPFPSNIVDIWGISATDIYAVGNENGKDFILHYDGYEWSTVRNLDIDANLNLVAIEGVSASEIYAVGTNGILRYDGNNWQELETKEKDFLDLTIVGSNDVYFVSSRYPNYGAIHHFDGMEIKREFSTVTVINSIWSSPKHGIFGVGNDGLILRKDIDN